MCLADYLSPVKDRKISPKTIKPSPFPINRTGRRLFFFTSMRYFPRVRNLLQNNELSLILDSCDLIRFSVIAERLNHIKEAFLWVSFYPIWVTFYPIKVQKVSVLSTSVAVLGKKMRYLFPPFLRYSGYSQSDREDCSAFVLKANE